MIPVSEVVLSIALLLTALIALQFNGCESGPFSKATVEITNELPNLQLIVHCKDKNHDLGSQTLDVGGKWSFSFMPNLIYPVTLYFCHFGWYGGDHWFDIYDQERDNPTNEFHPWDILESGPCRTVERIKCVHMKCTAVEIRQCYDWKDDIAGWRQLGDGENNTIGK